MPWWHGCSCAVVVQGSCEWYLAAMAKTCSRLSWLVVMVVFSVAIGGCAGV